MAIRELPEFSASSYSNTMVDMTGGTGLVSPILQHQWIDPAVTAARRHQLHKPIAAPNPEPKEQPVPLRMVQVFIADTNENVPLDDRMVYRGSQHLTDLTDQELFYEIDIRSLLERHNAIRTKTRDKSVKDRAEFLEPARVRDLKMSVVTIASF